MSANHKLNAADYDDALLRLVDLAVNSNAIAAAINAGGTGYTLGDVLTVSGGTAVSSLVTTLEVTSVAAGVIDGVRVMNCGAYSALPGNPVSVTGGSGTLATFNLTFETQNWILNRNLASTTALINYPFSAGGGGVQTLEREIQLQGPGNAGADEIFVGILQVRDTTVGSYNWAISGFTGFNAGLRWEEQPGQSYIDPIEIAAFVPLSNSAIECWFHVSPRDLKGVLRIGSSYPNFYMGFVNQFATPSEYPYPLAIMGCASKWNQLFSASGVNMSGLCDPGANTQSGGNSRGPGGVRFVDGVWYPVRNWSYNGNARNAATTEAAVYPCQQIAPQNGLIPSASRFMTVNDTTEWYAIVPDIGSPGSATHTLFPSDDGVNDLTLLFPTHIFMQSNSLALLGELADVFWGTTSGNNIVSQDRVVINGIYYRAFQNVNRTDAFAFIFLREDA